METIVCELMPNRIPARLCKENKNVTANDFFSDAPAEGGGI
jgi:hypothetical protein